MYDYLVRRSDELIALLPDTRSRHTYWIAYHESVRHVVRVQAVARFLVGIVNECRGDFAPERR